MNTNAFRQATLRFPDIYDPLAPMVSRHGFLHGSTVILMPEWRSRVSGCIDGTGSQITGNDIVRTFRRMPNKRLCSFSNLKISYRIFIRYAAVKESCPFAIYNQSTRNFLPCTKYICFNFSRFPRYKKANAHISANLSISLRNILDLTWFSKNQHRFPRQPTVETFPRRVGGFSGIFPLPVGDFPNFSRTSRNNMSPGARKRTWKKNSPRRIST